MRFAITAAVVLGLAGTASAATFVVPSQGIPNIQTAVNGASTGDTILIKKGWYRENVIVNASRISSRPASVSPMPRTILIVSAA